MFSVFMSMLASLGGSFTPFVAEERSNPKDKPVRDWNHRLRIRPLTAEKYTMTGGVVRRISPKRDRSISARQWKKQVKAERRAAKLQQ